MTISSVKWKQDWSHSIWLPHLVNALCSSLGPLQANIRTHVKNLGVVFDSEFKFNKQINSVVSASLFSLGVLFHPLNCGICYCWTSNVLRDQKLKEGFKYQSVEIYWSEQRAGLSLDKKSYKEPTTQENIFAEHL